MPSSRAVVMLCSILWCAATAQAAPVASVDPALLQTLHWRSIGPFRGGRVLTVSGVPGEPDHFYFGAVNGGVWETRNAGRTWSPIFDSAPVGAIGALAVAPSDPKVIYVGTGEADMRSDIAQGVGLFKSTDGGGHWQPIGLEDSQQIGRILVDPQHPDIVLVAALGHPYGANATRGVYRSTDGGKTWQHTLYKDADTGAIDLAFEPGKPSVVYAALWQTRRPPWSVYPPSSGPGSGLYKSTDGGQTWAAIGGHGLPAQPGRIGLAVAPSNPKRVFALVDAADGGLYRSDDAGASWTRASGDSRIWKRGWYFGGVTVDPRNADVIYVCNTAMYRSDDGGKTFVPVKGAPGGDDYHQLWIDPAEPQRRILAVDQGAVVTLDGGANWSSWFNQPTGQFYHVITDSRFPYWVYGAQQDSGAAGIPSHTNNIDGIHLGQFRETTAGGESDNIAPDPDDPELIFGGRVDKLDLRTGQTRNVDPTLAYPDLYRGAWTLPLVFSPIGRHALYFANQHIFRSTDRGQHWQVISPDLNRSEAVVPDNLDAATRDDYDHGNPRHGVVYSIGPSPLDEHLLWAGTDDGLVWRSTDDGGHWQNVTPAGLQAWSKIGVVEPSHFDRNTAYLAVDRHRLDDFNPYLYRTRDGGASWTPMATGIGAGGTLNAVNVVREDPVRRGLLYCGTERGVYVSFDDGDHWQPLQQNLPPTSVRDIQVHDSDLVIASHGRGFWIMDDIAPLRSLAQDAGGATRLLPPVTAYRERPSGFTGSPMPKDEPMAANPPLGATIDYVLAAGAVGPVTLRIIDADGATVRTLSSSDKAPTPDFSKIETAPEWILPRQPLATTVGAHRVIWDLQYAMNAVLAPDDNTELQQGIWAPPGQYRIELEVGGRKEQQTLTLAPDPRVKLPPEAYQSQFRLARDIEDARVRIETALGQAERLHDAIVDRAAHGDAALAAALAATDRQLVAISDIVPDKNPRNSMPPAAGRVGGLRNLSAAFRSLDRAVEGADGAPTADAIRSKHELDALLGPTLEQWHGFVGDAIPSLNRQLQGAGLAPLQP